MAIQRAFSGVNGLYFLDDESSFFRNYVKLTGPGVINGHSHGRGQVLRRSSSVISSKVGQRLSRINSIGFSHTTISIMGAARRVRHHHFTKSNQTSRDRHLTTEGHWVSTIGSFLSFFVTRVGIFRDRTFICSLRISAKEGFIFFFFNFGIKRTLNPHRDGLGR